MRWALIAQMVRYGLSGGTAAAIYAGAYWALGVRLGVGALLANTIAWIVALVSSFRLHSRWTFRDRVGAEKQSARARFVAINVGGYLLNSMWIWLLVEQLHRDVRLPLIPILCVTPWLMFYAMRRWAFG